MTELACRQLDFKPVEGRHSAPAEKQTTGKTKLDLQTVRPVWRAVKMPLVYALDCCLSIQRAGLARVFWVLKTLL